MQAGEALCNAARSMPVPVTLEHVVWPLLLSLARGPNAALALVGIGRTLGGALAAKHLLPPLLAVLASSQTVQRSWSGAILLRLSFLVPVNIRSGLMRCPGRHLREHSRCWSP